MNDCAAAAVVHGGIAHAPGCRIAAHEGIEATRPVDAEEQAEVRVGRRIVDVGKRADAPLAVAAHGAAHAVDYPRRAGRGGYFAGAQHPEGESVVGLVARPVRNRCAGLQAQLAGGGGREAPLLAKRGAEGGDEGGIDAVIVEQIAGKRVFAEVPEHPFGEAGGRRMRLARQAVGYVVARKHDGPDAFVEGGLVVLHPLQLRSREVSRRIEAARQADLLPYRGKGPAPRLHGAGVAPDDGRAHGEARFVQADEAVHLVGDTHGPHLRGLHAALGKDAARGLPEVAPPLLRMLLGPARGRGEYRHFHCGTESGGCHPSRLHLEEARLYGRTSDVITYRIHDELLYEWIVGHLIFRNWL